MHNTPVTAAEDLHNVPRAMLKAAGRVKDKCLYVLGMAYFQELWRSIQNTSLCLNFCTKSLFISLQATLPIAHGSENTDSLTKAVWGFHSNQHCFGERNTRRMSSDSEKEASSAVLIIRITGQISIKAPNRSSSAHIIFLFP